MHTPLSCDGWVLVQKINHVSWSDNRHIGIDCFHLLLSDPLSAQTFRLRIRVSTGSRDVDESLHMARVFDSLCDGHRNADIGIFEVFLLLVVDLGTDAADNNIAIANCVADLPLRGKII